MVEHSEPVPPAGRRGLALRRRDIAVLAVALVVLGVLLYLLIRPAGRTGINGSAVSSSHGAYAGLAETRPLPAPPLRLDNYLGAPFNLASYRGKAVFVTFLYTHCPDVCPVITSHLHTAITQMSAAERREVAIVAVSVDPRGDTPKTVAQFLQNHEMTGRMQYLLGSAAVLGRVWRDWGVSSSPQTQNPELVAHSALIYGISAHGKVTVIYPENFSPSEIVHDAPLLARS
jgi:protein SCO1/2